MFGGEVYPVPALLIVTLFTAPPTSMEVIVL